MGLYNELKAQIEAEPENAQAHYRLARVEYEIFERYTFSASEWGIEADEELAERYLEASWQSAERAVELDETLSDAHRLIGQNVNRLIPYKGMGFAISNSVVPQREARIALQHDEDNAMAYLARGQAFMFTPEQFGGDPIKATESFERGLDLAHDDHERFLANVWVAWSLINREKFTDAESYLEAALNIYPNSTWAKWLLEQV